MNGTGGEKKLPQLSVYALVLLGMWALVVGLSLAWNIDRTSRQALELARQEALANFNKDQAFRLWGTLHGGVYVPTTEATPPSPYMAHIPERDVVTPSGRTLTLLNPNYMVRQLAELHQERFGIRGHITGLRQLRPENAPDPWEVKALHAFETGVEEVVEAADIDGQPFLRLMRPMVMEEGCMKCHGHLGFKVGDVRGGVGVAVPLAPYLASATQGKRILLASHGGIWLVGSALILVSAALIRRRLDETRAAEAALRTLNSELEQRVEERTRALADKEERLRTMVSTAADGILTADGQGRIESVNAAACAIFGYAESDLVGASLDILSPSLSLGGNHQRYLEDYARTGHSPVIGHGREVMARRKNGSTFPLHLAVSAMHLGNRLMFTSIVRDLSAEKHAEAELLAAKEQADTARRLAEKANSAKTQFLASMSHELRTPLNAILGYAQLIEHLYGPLLEEKLLSYVRSIKSGGSHLYQLIDEILDLAKIEAGGLSLSIEAVPLAELAAECLELVQAQAQARRVEIRLHAESLDGLVVAADYLRLKQVVVNLLSNAIKYNRLDGMVAVRTSPLDDGHIRLSVSDTGIGIPPERMPELFQPFNRLGNETGPVEGTGIGLSITKRLVELMAGRIWVESTPGLGSVFHVELPQAQPHHRSQPQPPRPAADGLRIADGHHIILYVEDNPNNQRLMADFLGGFPNVSLLLASSAESGIETALHAHPDLILMDINLPGISGLQALELLRGHPETAAIPVIALSAAALPVDIKSGLAAGFTAYLVKPLDLARTVDAINMALTR